MTRATASLRRRASLPLLSPFVLSLALSFALLITQAPLARACSTPPAGCTISACRSLYNLTNSFTPYQSKGGSTADKRIGFVYGVYNKNLPSSSSSQRGGGIVNWEVFPAVETDFLVKDKLGKTVDSTWVRDLPTCCALCAQTDGCFVYQYIDADVLSQMRTIWDQPVVKPKFKPYNVWDYVRCYLLTGGMDKSETSRGAPYSGTHTEQLQETGYPNKYIAASWVGGLCNGNTSVVDDPHFVGAHGTRFEFNGDVNHTFVLISDDRLHMNIKLGGYLDDNTFGATKRKDGKAVRTWIREIGLLWRDEQGVRHSAVLVARNGRRMERGNGFISSLEVDGRQLAVPTTLEKSAKDGMFSLTLGKVYKRGPYDVEKFELAIEGLLTLVVKLRAAHPVLQTDHEAFAHFNVHILDLQATPNVHGILGQTFRSTLAQSMKSLEYRLLGQLLGEPVVADGETGRGFLDGDSAGYQTSGILATDSKFSTFKQ